MITIVMKWGFLLIIISALVIALSNTWYRTVIIKHVKPYIKQILLIALMFTVVLLISLNGT